MKAYDAQTLRRLQLAELQIYKDFAAFCKANGLLHMVVDGTLLGAVRHEGFIPWDDDMDIMMPRKDYERFLRLADDLKEGYDVLSIERTKGYVLPFAKMCKKGTLFVEATDQDRTYHSGIFIDIMPFDKTSSDEIKRQKQIKKTFRLARLIVLTEYKQPKLPAGMTGATAKLMHFGCGVVHGFFKLFGITKKRLYKKYLRRATEYEDGEWLMNITDYYTAKTAGPKETFFPPSTVVFEEMTVPAFHNPAAYLTSYYGQDYMTLPPEEKRRNHAPSVLDFGDGPIS